MKYFTHVLQLQENNTLVKKQGPVWKWTYVVSLDCFLINEKNAMQGVAIAAVIDA